MKINISKIMIGVSVLACLGVFGSNQVWGMETCGLINNKSTLTKGQCDQRPGCKWVVTGGCYDGDPVCTRDAMIIQHEALCNHKAKQGHHCKWRPIKEYCTIKLDAKKQKKS